MTPRERAKAEAQYIADRWHTMSLPTLTERIEAAIAEHVRALLADDEATIEALATIIRDGDYDDSHITALNILAALRRKALRE